MSLARCSLLQETLKYNNLLRNQNRSFSITSNLCNGKKPQRVAITLQNPFTWLNNKIEFAILRKKWDPEFSDKAFLEASKHAVAHVSCCAARLDFKELVGLLSSKALDELQTELSNWNSNKLTQLYIDQDDIVSAVPVKISMQEIASNKYCDITVLATAVKIDPAADAKVKLLKFNARFFRNYTEGCLPDWTITKFKINV